VRRPDSSRQRICSGLTFPLDVRFDARAFELDQGDPVRAIPDQPPPVGRDGRHRELPVGDLR
jgi:hypothetical protein